jgi:hypothetical protein
VLYPWRRRVLCVSGTALLETIVVLLSEQGVVCGRALSTTFI